MSFPTLIIHSFVEVHRSSAKSHDLFLSIFIHRIIVNLGLEDFSASEPIHIIAPIGATFLRQMDAQMQASSKRPRVESSSSALPPPPLSSSGDPATDAFIDPTDVADPPPFASDVSSICRTLDTIMTIQTAHGQFLVDVLTEL